MVLIMGIRVKVVIDREVDAALVLHRNGCACSNSIRNVSRNVKPNTFAADLFQINCINLFFLSDLFYGWLSWKRFHVII